MTLIATTTVGAGGASSIDFTSIPATPYTDLLVVVSGRSTATAGDDPMRVYFNGSTSSYTVRYLYGSGSGTASGTNGNYTGTTIPDANATSNTFGNVQIYIPNYAGSTNKSFSVDGVTENNGTTALQMISASLWSNTAAITSISLDLVNGNFTQYATASLYGITKGSGGATVSP
jgi:hypothetical protein